MTAPPPVEGVAERIEAAMAALFVLDGKEFVPSVSIGIAYNDPPMGPDELIRDADTAMYVAKGGPGSAHATFNTRLRHQAIHRVTLEGELRRGIERDEFVMYYQPIVDLRTRRWAAVESLVPWQHPTRGLLAPDLFIPLAEETGLIVPLGDCSLHQVVMTAVELRGLLPPGGVALNVSARQLARPEFDAEVFAALDEHGLPAAFLTIEITETALMEKFSAANVALTRLAERGMPLVLDDFGSGYSSIPGCASSP